jgi:hypothetical protein
MRPAPTPPTRSCCTPRASTRGPLAWWGRVRSTSPAPLRLSAQRPARGPAPLATRSSRAARAPRHRDRSSAAARPRHQRGGRALPRPPTSLAPRPLRALVPGLSRPRPSPTHSACEACTRTSPCGAATPIPLAAAAARPPLAHRLLGGARPARPRESHDRHAAYQLSRGAQRGAHPDIARSSRAARARHRGCVGESASSRLVPHADSHVREVLVGELRLEASHRHPSRGRSGCLGASSPSTAAGDVLPAPRGLLPAT